MKRAKCLLIPAILALLVLRPDTAGAVICAPSRVGTSPSTEPNPTSSTRKPINVTLPSQPRLL